MKDITTPLIILGLLLFTAKADAATHQAQLARLDRSTTVLNEVMSIPETIPADLIRNAYGIAVFPSVYKAAFIVGARFGEGIFVARQANGNWSEPSFVNLYGASFGFQGGAEATDLILVFKTKQSVDALGRGDFTLGGTASVAAGPVGRSAQASTDIQLRAEIYSYSKTRGLFVGVALDGAGIQVDTGANNALYGTPDPARSAAVRVPTQAKRFDCVVAKYTGSPTRVCT